MKKIFLSVLAVMTAFALTACDMSPAATTTLPVKLEVNSISDLITTALQLTGTGETTTETPSLTVFTIAELAKYNGDNGTLAYMAVNGIVYDVSNASGWTNGWHQGMHLAGTDASAIFAGSPHSASILNAFPVVGTIGTTPTEPVTPTLPIFTMAQIATFNGDNGADAYIVVEGIVYDVSNASGWTSGWHRGMHLAGTDATAIFAGSPHSASILNSFPIVGTLEGVVVDPIDTEAGASTDNVPLELDQETIDYYLALLDTFFSESSLMVQTVVSDKPEYQTQLVIQTKDQLGNPISYTLYYNETPISELPLSGSNNDSFDSEAGATEDDSNSSDDDYHFDDDFDNEVESVLVGLLLIGEEVYELEGKKVVETDETKYVLRSFVDSLNYLTIRFETKADEQKFSLEIVENGILVSATKVKVETEAFETKVAIEFREGVNYANYVFKLETEDGQQEIKIRTWTITDSISNSGEVKIIVTTDEVTGETTYVFVENGSNDNDDDDDDDDRYEDEDDNDDDDEDDDDDRYEDEDDDDDDDDEDDDDDDHEDDDRD
jgi:predicted heme/steroid binding protein